MTQTFAYRFSSFIMVVLAFWVIWLWVKPETKTVVVQKRVQPVAVLQKAPAPEQQKASVFILPPPPAPKPAPTPTPKPVAVSAPDPVEEPAPQKVAPVPKETAQPVSVEKPVVEETRPPKPLVKKESAEKKHPLAPTPKAHVVTKKDQQNGRAMLRILEHGKGPLIEIAWPQGSGRREQLFQTLRRCYGMENAVMAGNGDLFRKAETSGRRWEINLDRYSAFLRQTDGSIPRGEQKVLAAIQRQHHGLRGTAIRIFPRHVDASLLGGLKSLIGANYLNTRSIQARYRMQGQTVLVGDLIVDGQRRDGLIQLALAHRC